MNERTHKILLDAIGIKKAFVVINVMFEKGVEPWDTGYRLGNLESGGMESGDISAAIELLARQFKNHQFKEHEVLDVYAVAFYEWNEGEFEDGKQTVASYWDLSHVEVLTQELVTMPVITAGENYLPF